MDEQGSRTHSRAGARLLPLLALGLALAGCDVLGGGEPPLEPGPARLPEATCRQVDDTLRGLQENVMINFGAAGEATIEQAGWQAMGRTARDQVVTALAVRAACGVERPAAEQAVTIRNEAGDVLAERTVQVWEGQAAE